MNRAEEEMTMDVAAWLTQIWDEEERLAKLAGGDRWVYDGGSDIHRERHEIDRVVDWVYDEAWEHIAYHDPASVLARIAADRKILEHMRRRQQRVQFTTSDIEVLCLLASAYADRPGYREEWRPLERQESGTSTAQVGTPEDA